MSAGTPAVLTGQRVSDEPVRLHPLRRTGYTSITTGTMNRLVAAIAADAFQVPLRDVRAGLSDDDGQLNLSLTVPLRLTVDSFSTDPGSTVFARAARAREVVAQRVHTLAGAAVCRVDIRFTGSHDANRANAGRVT